MRIKQAEKHFEQFHWSMSMTIPICFQIVKYTADPYGYGGYVADVKYEGYAKYPDHKPAYHPAPKPAYHKIQRPWYAECSWKQVMEVRKYYRDEILC